MDDTRARFLTAIAGRLGADRIVELHLFSPIRQGVLETGVAVVAVAPGEEDSGAGTQWGAEAQAQWGAGDTGGAEAEGEGGADTGGAEAEGEGGADTGGAEAEGEGGAGEGEIAESSDSPYLPVPEHPTVPVDPTLSEHPTVPVPEHPTVPVPRLAERLVVFTARYRLTRKGPDRGKWLFECGATADAPLATVDAVARGVTQRSKDLTETERLSGDQLRTLLQDPAWRMPA